MLKEVYILTGSNMGDRVNNLSGVVDQLGKKNILVEEVSSLYQSPPWGFEAPVPFLNQAIKISTDLKPSDLLRELLQIEVELGRVRNAGAGYSSRPIDIDIIFYGQERIKTDSLTVPHPELIKRRFALMPLVEIAGAFIHPVYNKSLSELLADCIDKSYVVKYD